MVMSFGVKDVGATYYRAMTYFLHNMIHQKLESYVDNLVYKSIKDEKRSVHLASLLERFMKYNVIFISKKILVWIQKGKDPRLHDLRKRNRNRSKQSEEHHKYVITF